MIIKRMRVLYFGFKTANGRIYLEKDFNIDELNEKALKKTALGELDHPSSLEISLRNVSHSILKYEKDNLGLLADILILNTPNGKIAKTMINYLVLRPRAVGNILPNGNVTNYKLITCDLINKKDDDFSTASIRRFLLNKKLKKIKAIC